MTKTKQKSLVADQSPLPRRAVWLRREMKKNEMAEVCLSPSELLRHAEKTTSLTPQELQVIKAIFVENKSVEETGKTAGINGGFVTRTRVREIEFKALRKITGRIRRTSPGLVHFAVRPAETFKPT